MERRFRWATAALTALAMAVLAACGVEAGRPVGETAVAEDLSSSEVLAELRGSVALIETPAGTGSAVLLADGYLLTNAHVVDPFGAVDVTFEGGEPATGVPVVGVDLVADLAVVGPVPTDAEPPAIIDPVLLEPGSEVYLVGFPGDQREQEVTLARGVISRSRSADPWGLEYLQTDTIIAGGQSGGALVDTSGRVVGISGFQDGDGFALSLSGADVLARVDDLLDGGERAWEPAPTGPLETVHTVTPGDDWPTGLYLPYADEDVELSVTVPEGTAVAFVDPGSFLYPWGVNQAGSEVGDGAYWDPSDVSLLELDGSTATGEVYRGSDAVVLVLAPADGGPIDVETSEEMVSFTPSDDLAAISTGDTATGVLNRIDDSDLYEIELDAGESVEIAARSATGDVAWEARGASEDPEATVFTDDGGGGLFDLDAVDTYTAESGGTHYIWVYDYDDTAIAYELTVTAG